MVEHKQRKLSHFSVINVQREVVAKGVSFDDFFNLESFSIC